MKTKQRHRLRLRSKRKPRLAKPRESQGKSFALRALSEADSRFAVVKLLRRRLEKLNDDAGVNSIQKEMLAGRAVFLVGYLESLEVSAMEGKAIDFGSYTSVLNSLTGVLNKLGLNKQLAKQVETLEEYTAGRDLRKKKKR